MRTRNLAITALALGVGLPAAANNIAVTEFIVNPWGTDVRTTNSSGELTGGYEWIELFNHGADSVNLEGWTLKDNASSVFTFGDVSVESGGYIVASSAKPLFEERWLEGQSDDRVIDGVPFQMNNGGAGDGLYLRDDNGDLVWSVGYTEHDAYRANFLAVDDFSENNFGIPPQDDPLNESVYINTDGNDGNAATDLGLGYESNARTTDPFAYASAAGNEENPTPEWGSPLQGGYTAVPEPGSLALLGLGGLAMLQRRRRTAGQ